MELDCRIHLVAHAAVANGPSVRDLSLDSVWNRSLQNILQFENTFIYIRILTETCNRFAVNLKKQLLECR
jgi:hypothetical protein